MSGTPGHPFGDERADIPVADRVRTGSAPERGEVEFPCKRGAALGCTVPGAGE